MNPVSFFIRELLLLLREEGKVLHGSQGWNAASGVVELGITEGVREIVQRRVRRLSEEANHLLSEEANHLLSVGAAFNGAFSFEVAAPVDDLDEQAALTAIDEALETQLLRPGTHADSFDFSHAFILHTLYAELNPVRRVRRHRRLCALQRRHDEAYEWFAHARAVLDEQSARPLRAITDFDEALMNQRREDRDGHSPANPLLGAAVKSFRTLGMTGWTRRTEQLALGN